MQIQIYSPAPGDEIKAVEWNFQELKTWIQEGLKKYEGVVYTPEDIPAAKKDRADLNRLAKAISDKRIEMKRQFMEPLKTFEAQAKELTDLIEQQAASIDYQVKEFEQVEKEAKLAEIKAIYAEEIGELADLIPYERIHNPKWLNKGTTLKAIREDIGTLVSRTKTAFTMIGNMGLDEATTNRVKAAYLKNFELADAIAEKDRIETENRRLREYELKQQAEAKARAEAEAAAKTSDKPAETAKPSARVIEPPQEETVAEHKPESQETAELIQIDFRVHATRQQLNDLKHFLIVSGIKYGPVPVK